tara:strand:- start:210 stop:437 length:228 start_codon:yes stop_codon:yes gene_type:complete
MSIADMTEMHNLLDETADCFEDLMKQLFDEVPEAVPATSQMDWSGQVSDASDDFRKELTALVQRFEIKLKHGEFK